ncbi:uncharacterized protein ZBIST_1954 [Zygosaccharomyces bailii]|nr:uncharacterized protein ZBIST_1954 [Zygosaccharomyces bailii]
MTRPTRSQLVKTFIGSNIVALGAGTPYLYSFYAPQLLSQCHIPISKVSMLSFSLNLGSSLLGFLAGMVIDKNPAVSCLIGTFCTFFGYATLDYCYQREISSALLISTALCLIGYGSISGFYASVKCCATNFPHHRGTAGAFPVSLYALAGMMYAAICSSLFGDDMGKVFKFLTVVCSAGIFTGCLTIRILIHPKQHQHRRQRSIPRPTLEQTQAIAITNRPDFPAATAGNKQDQASLRSNSSGASSFQSMWSTSGTDSYLWSTELTGSLPFWGWGRERDTNNQPNPPPSQETPRMPIPSHSRPGLSYASTNQARRRESLPFSNFTAKRDSFKRDDREIVVPPVINEPPPTILEPASTTTKSKSWKENYVLHTITSPRFITYYIILATLQGIGQTYIYCVGFIVQTQISSLPPSQGHLNPEKIQSIQVSIISILSFAGRLSSGPVSDLLVKKLKAQRMWNIVLAGLMMFWGSTQMLRKIPVGTISSVTSLPESLTNISICSAIFGFAFGVVFGTYPPIIADSFGTAAFSTIWGISTSGGLPTIKIFAAVLGRDLDKHTNPGDTVCKRGVECYAHTFHVTQLCSAAVILLILSVIGVTFWETKRRELKNANPFSESLAEHEDTDENGTNSRHWDV